MSNKREQIMRTAMQLFCEEGFHATPTSKIAKEAGVATGTLFHHFESKEALINELYIYVKTRLREALKKNLDFTADTRSIFLQLWKNDLYWFIQHYDEFIFLQLHHHSNVIMEHTRQMLYDDYSDIIEQFQKAIAQNNLKSDNLEYVLCNFIFNVNQNCIYFHDHPTTFNDQTVEAHFEIYYSGLSR